MDLLDAQKTLTSFKYREYHYKEEADPLFLQWQREEIEKQVWLDKIAEIKERYAYPAGCTVEAAQARVEEEMAKPSESVVEPEPEPETEPEQATDEGQA